MSDTAVSLQRKIVSAGDLHSVVRTMKAMAASSITQYEQAMHSLDAYYDTVQRGLSVCLTQISAPDAALARPSKTAAVTGVVVFGSDQGLVGQFNDEMVRFVLATLASQSGAKKVWAIGERIASRLNAAGFDVGASLVLPRSIRAVAPLVGQILIELEAHGAERAPPNQPDNQESGAWSPMSAAPRTATLEQVFVFYHGADAGSRYAPLCQRLLPLDAAWRDALVAMPWPNRNLPEVMPSPERTLRGFIHEYLFVSLYRACAASLASENASRLAAMQRAEKNIEEQLEDLNRTFQQLRQGRIDEELFDVISGFEALSVAPKST